jgi:hypothetical protein
MNAAETGEIDLVNFLISKNADVNKMTSSGETLQPFSP